MLDESGFWQSSSTVLDPILTLVSILAIFVGGVWAYFNYFKGRTYRPRLELDVAGTILKKGARSYAVVRPQVKNVGLSNVNISQRGTGLRISCWTIDGNLSHVTTRAILEDHSWIEPSEPIGDPQLIELPVTDAIAVLAEVRIVSADAIQWKAKAILHTEREAVSNEHEANGRG
jgi:hypothetical protein